MIKRFPWFMFSVVFGWKIALFIFTAQPVPANDAFFYDGAVIHKLLHGGYFNPSLARALTISGTQLYSTYPPLYQALLMVWLAIFGVSALKVMALHVVLFGAYCVTLYAVLRRLLLAPWCINLAGAFLFSFTFHDRPDSLAHCLGMAAIYFWVRRLEARRAEKDGAVAGWGMSLAVVLALCTSLQIGGIYFGVILCANAFAFLFNKVRPPVGPLFGMVLLPVGLVLLVKFTVPLAWAGFLEHARQTPSFTGLRVPQLPEIAKIIRTVPGILLVMVLLPVCFLRRTKSGLIEVPLTPALSPSEGERVAGGFPSGIETLLLSTLFGALGVILLSLFILTPNTIAIANYLQPIIVATFIGSHLSRFPNQNWMRLQLAGFICAAVLVSVRAAGMTTWGAICADDVSHRRASELVENAIARQPAGSRIVMSSAFLYDAAHHTDVEMIHSDWLGRAGGDSRVTDVNALIALQPGEMILTQFDYYRRFEQVLRKVQESSATLQIQITNTAHVRAPDSYKSFQQVVQNVSWAPVIVTFAWPVAK